MDDFIFDNVEHVLCVLIFISRLTDIGSTWMVTPKLRLEANPIVRKLGWKYAILTTLACLIPYYDPGIGLMCLVVFLLVSSANIGKAWFVRAMGEEEYEKLLITVARKSKLRSALWPMLTSCFFLFFVGLILLYLYPDQETDWGYDFALGIMLYTVIVAFYGTLSMFRLFKKAKVSAPCNEMAAEKCLDEIDA